MLILLNGTSSAGKTTLAKALQDTLHTPYLLVGIDTVVFALPSRYVNDAAYPKADPIWLCHDRALQKADGQHRTGYVDGNPPIQWAGCDKPGRH